jgi:hypothetical protein
MSINYETVQGPNYAAYANLPLAKSSRKTLLDTCTTIQAPRF